MSNIHALNRRIDKMLADIHRQTGDGPPLFTKQGVLTQLTVELLTERERVLLTMHLEEIFSSYPDGIADLRTISDESLDRLHNWFRLDAALLAGDEMKAEEYRYTLRTNIDALLTSFLAISEDSIPANFEQAPVAIDEYGALHRLYRINFRHDRSCVERAIQDNRWVGIIDTMSRWVRAFSATAA